MRVGIQAGRRWREMLDFCGQHNITADVEVIPIQKVNEAYDRLSKADVRYRFSIDMASLNRNDDKPMTRGGTSWNLQKQQS